jgi:hypothetical protein
MIPRDIEHIRYKRLFFSVNDNFLSSKPELNADINYCIQSPVNVNNQLEEFYTPLIDLSNQIETIKEKIYHRTLSEINSFISNQAHEYQFHFDLSEQELQKFINLYDKFAASKNIRKAEAYRLKAYHSEKLLAITCIKQGRDILCINFYRVTKKRASNLYSFTVEPIKNKISSSQLGRAHRALHWLDIMKFKDLGTLHYDFCGWYPGSDNKALLNINKFKEQFTNNIVKEFNGVIYNSKLLLLLKKLRG